MKTCLLTAQDSSQACTYLKQLSLIFTRLPSNSSSNQPGQHIGAIAFCSLEGLGCVSDKQSVWYQQKSPLWQSYWSFAGCRPLHPKFDSAAATNGWHPSLPAHIVTAWWEYCNQPPGPGSQRWCLSVSITLSFPGLFYFSTANFMSPTLTNCSLSLHSRSSGLRGSNEQSVCRQRKAGICNIWRVSCHGSQQAHECPLQQAGNIYYAARRAFQAQYHHPGL